MRCSWLVFQGCASVQFCLFLFLFSCPLQFCNSLCHRWSVAHSTEPFPFPGDSLNIHHSIMQVAGGISHGHTCPLMRTKEQILKVNCQVLIQVTVEIFWEQSYNLEQLLNFLLLSSLKWENWSKVSFLTQVLWFHTGNFGVNRDTTVSKDTISKTFRSYHSIRPT